MWGELNLVRCQMELFEHFAGVAVSEDGVCGEIVGGAHEVGVCRRGFSGSAYSRLRIADDTVVNIDQPSLQEWRECKNDGGGIASGVCNETGAADLVAMQLRASIDCFGLQRGGVLGVRVGQAVDGA